MNLEKTVSLGIIVFSLLYILFALSIEERTIGRLTPVGPTARTLPITLGVVMLGLGTLLSFQAFCRSWGTTKKDEPGFQNSLIVAAVGLCIVYVLLFRLVGFVLTTSTLLFILIYLSRTRVMAVRGGPWLVGGLLVNTGVMIAIFWLSRTLIRTVASYGRASDIALLANRSFVAIAALFITVAVTLALFFLFRKRINQSFFSDAFVSILAALSTTQVLYLVFREIFLVNLPFGLLRF